MDYTVGLGGGDGGYTSRGIPAAWLVGVDGKVLWQGHPSSLPEKTLEAELKKVGKPTDEEREARAAKAVEYARTLAGHKRYFEAAELLGRTAKEWKGTEGAKAAEAAKAAMEKDEAVAAELSAQKELARVVGGSLEVPKEKLKSKERDAMAVRLEVFIRKHGEKAPGAVALAESWARVMREDWKKE